MKRSFNHYILIISTLCSKENNTTKSSNEAKPSQNGKIVLFLLEYDWLCMFIIWHKNASGQTDLSPLQNLKVMMLDSDKISLVGKFRYTVYSHLLIEVSSKSQWGCLGSLVDIKVKIMIQFDVKLSFFFLISDIQRWTLVNEVMKHKWWSLFQ